MQVSEVMSYEAPVLAEEGDFRSTTAGDGIYAQEVLGAKLYI